MHGTKEIGEMILPRRWTMTVAHKSPAFTDSQGRAWPAMVTVDYEPAGLGGRPTADPWRDADQGGPLVAAAVVTITAMSVVSGIRWQRSTS